MLSETREYISHKKSITNDWFLLAMLSVVAVMGVVCVLYLWHKILASDKTAIMQERKALAEKIYRSTKSLSNSINTTTAIQKWTESLLFAIFSCYINRTKILLFGEYAKSVKRWKHNEKQQNANNHKTKGPRVCRVLFCCVIFLQIIALPVYHRNKRQYFRRRFLP